MCTRISVIWQYFQRLENVYGCVCVCECVNGRVSESKRFEFEQDPWLLGVLVNCQVLFHFAIDQTGMIKYDAKEPKDNEKEEGEKEKKNILRRPYGQSLAEQLFHIPSQWMNRTAFECEQMY